MQFSIPSTDSNQLVLNRTEESISECSIQKMDNRILGYFLFRLVCIILTEFCARKLQLYPRQDRTLLSSYTEDLYRNCLWDSISRKLGNPHFNPCKAAEKKKEVHPCERVDNSSSHGEVQS